MLKTIKVDLADRSYDIIIGRGSRSYLISETQVTKESGTILIITDATVKELWLAAVGQYLPAATQVVTVPPGENSKSLRAVEGICEQLAASRVDRSGLIIALGGGMIGDLAGFVAAVWNRGIPFVQIPTTLLAAIDASVGGKTGVNIKAGKNLVGAFHQPRLVVVDTEFLGTLPDREFAAGLAESVKHAVIRDAALLDWHEAQTGPITARDEDVVTELIARNCAIKADVVSRDEREAGLRAVLNHGHTIGHAIEAELGFELLHGECVALGMIAENEIAVARGLLSRSAADRVRSLLERLRLPTRLSRAVGADAIWHYCAVDKKNQAGAVNCVLIRSIGEPVRVRDVTADEVAAALSAIQP